MDFSPYEVLEKHPGEFNLIQVRNPPLILRQALRPDSKPDFDEDTIVFKSLSVPEAALGFTDLELNISGLLLDVPQGSADSRWAFFRPRSMSYPLDVLLHFEYNALGFDRSTHPSLWLPTPPAPPVDFRVSLYNDRGLKLVETSATFFPEDQRAEIYETVRLTAVNLALAFVPYSVRNLITQSTSSFWQGGEVPLFEHLKFPQVHTQLPRLLKLRVSPKLPLKNVALVIQAKAAAPIALLQRFPRLLPLSLAAVFAVCASLAACATSLIISAVFLTRLPESDQSQNLRFRSTHTRETNISASSQNTTCRIRPRH